MASLAEDFDTARDIRLKARQRLTEDAFSAAMGGMRGGGGFSAGPQGMGAAKEQYRHNRGIVYANTRPVANRLAAQPMCVGRVVKGESKSMLKSHDFAKLPNSVKQVVYNAGALGIERIDSHPLLDALHDPNEFMTAFHLRVAVHMAVPVAGVHYILVLDSKRPGMKFDLWPLPKTMIRPDPSKGLRGGWLFCPDGAADPIPVPGNRVIPIYDIDIENPFGSKSVLEAAAQHVLTHEAIIASQKSAFDNGIRPGIAVSVGEVENPKGGMSKPQLEHWQAMQIEERLNQMHRGSSKHNGIVILDGIIEKVMPFTMKPMEMDFLSSSTTTKKAVDQIFGVSPVIKGEDENANRAAALVAGETFNDNVANPALTQFSQCINAWLVPLFDDSEDLVFWVEPCTSKDPDQERQNYQLLVDNACMTRDELRAKFGMGAMPGGNSVVLPLAKIIVPVQEQDEQEQIVGGNAGDMALNVLSAFQGGQISQEQAIQWFVEFARMDRAQAEEIVGDEPEPPPVALLPAPKPNVGGGAENVPVDGEVVSAA
jgi:HK97 family phage portal protein